MTHGKKLDARSQKLEGSEKDRLASSFSPLASAEKHLVFASSSSVYGLNTKMPFSVHDNVDHPASLYGATKKSNELMAHAYSHLYGLPTTGLRFFTVYGPWGRPDMAYFKFTKAILEGKPIDVYGEGNMKRDFTYIDDIVEGVVRVSDKIPEPGTGNPEPGTGNLESGTWNREPGTGNPEPGTGNLEPGTRNREPGTGNPEGLFPGPRSQVPGSQVPGPRSQVPGSPGPRSQVPGPGSRVPGPAIAPYRIYNIGNNSPVELMDFIKAIEEALGKRARMNMLPMQMGDVPETYADVDDLIKDVGFAPSTSIQDGIGKICGMV